FCFSLLSSPPFTFFLPCFRDLLHLHSFPTRRSSDLFRECLHLPSLILLHYLLMEQFHYQIYLLLKLVLPYVEKRSQTHLVVLVRSEEHTSELQSRFDLVCRLLLEKKKNT